MRASREPRDWPGSSPSSSPPSSASDVTRLDYASCADDADVVLYTIEGGGHTWPGGGPLPEYLVGSTSNSVDATRVMWEFFREHPLSTK